MKLPPRTPDSTRAGERARALGVLVVVLLVLVGCGSADSGPDRTQADPAESETVASTATDPSETTAAPETTERPTEAPPTALDFPEVIEAKATLETDGVWKFDVTLSAPYDTPEQYADAWRILGPDGTEYGIRVLAHAQSAHPFTRSQSGITIPQDVTVVTVQARDLLNGWSDETLAYELPQQ